jgi:hypothetical protein
MAKLVQSDYQMAHIMSKLAQSLNWMELKLIFFDSNSFLFEFPKYGKKEHKGAHSISK